MSYSHPEHPYSEHIFMNTEKNETKSNENMNIPGVLEFGEKVGCDTEAKIVRLRSVGEDALVRLKKDIAEEIEHYFLKSHATYTRSQLMALENAVSVILQRELGTVTAVPIKPGGGKSTMIRAALKVLSPYFCDMNSPVATHFGGIIVVVEKSSEGHELEILCNQCAGQEVATLVEAANDFNLGLGQCINGTASRYEECLHRYCPDYDNCPLMQSRKRLHETPILILLHARYQRYIEHTDELAWWESCDGRQHTRSVLLVDELPNLFDEGAVSLQTLSEAVLEIECLKPSYQFDTRVKKQELIYHWNRYVQTPYIRLLPKISTEHGPYGLIMKQELTKAGFDPESLNKLKSELLAYAENTCAEKIVDTLLNRSNSYFAVEQSVSIFLPRLKVIHGEDKPATFIFSGTASLSPELANNSTIRILDDPWHESYARLTFYAQHGEAVSASKTGLQRGGQLQVAAMWVSNIIDIQKMKHQKFLVVTFKAFSEQLWTMLQEWHDRIIPYIDGCGDPQPRLPYYGGVTGSNQYLEASCVICVGLNRFEPKDYLMRTLALDENGTVTTRIQEWLNEGSHARLDQNDDVMTVQDITLARDIVQLVFRSTLRHHGSGNAVDCWLLQPPKGVLASLQNYFGDCNIERVPEFPDSCVQAAIANKTYRGELTHVSKLMRWLRGWDGHAVSPEDIRKETGLSQAQFKEARRHKDVRKFFETNVTATGSGRYTTYQISKT